MIAAYLAETLVARGHVVSVVTTCQPEQDQVVSDVRNGVQVYSFFPRNRYWLQDRRPRALWEKAAWHLRDAHNTHAASVVGGIIDEFGPDLLHTHNIDGFSPVVWTLGAKRGLPVVHTSHDYHLLCPRANLVNSRGEVCVAPHPICRLPYRFWYGRAARAIDVFCSPSQTLIDLHRAAGFETGRYELIHNGIPLPRPKPRRGVRDLNEGAVRLLYCGLLSAVKGVALLLDVLRLLPRDLPLTLDVAGTGPMADDVRAAANDDPRIRVHGFVTGDAKALLFERSDVLLFPSLWYENAPTTIFEARAYGMAVFASDFGGMREFVRDGVTGRLLRKGDTKGWADAIGALATSPGQLTAWQDQTSKGIEEFSVEAMTNRYEQVYMDALSKENRGSMPTPGG